MAVKTLLTDGELARVASEWGLGALASARGLPEGSVNTLYVLETSRGRFVLRLSEGRREQELRFETSLLAYLARAHFPAAVLVPRLDGAEYGVVKERFAVVFEWASGEHLAPKETTAAQAMDAGRLMGRMHVVTEDFPGSLPNRYGVGPVRAMVAEVGREAALRPDDEELRAALPLLEREAAALDHLPALDSGVIHADWFPDNVRFLGDRVSAVLDFEMACRGPYVLDLATAIHAGCYDDDYSIERASAFVRGYEGERPLARAEKEAFHAWARFSALRFTASRVLDFHLSPLSGERLVRKDWRRFRDRLQKTVAMGPRGWAALCGL
jgi:homoserine kinase type II